LSFTAKVQEADWAKARSLVVRAGPSAFTGDGYPADVR
jgi:hypothetical protein